MGLDASVMCNCFRDGKTTRCPFPPDWLAVDEEGYLNLKQGRDSDQNWGRFHKWQQSCCSHNGMNLVRERISNWSGYRLFQEALGELGWQRFTVLKEQLPDSNGGLTSAVASAQALEELDLFASAGTIGTKTVLVDTASGEHLYEYIAAYDGVFILSGSRGIDVGLDSHEFSAIDRSSGIVLFRATRFRQYHKSGAAVSGDNDGIVWENLDTGELYESGIAVSGKQIPWDDGSWQKPNGQCRFEYPSEFHVEHRERTVTDFALIVNALKTVFEASVQTANPVRWS